MADDTPRVTAALADYVATAADRPVPDDVADLARHHTLAAIVACRDLPAARLAARYAVAQSGGASAPVPILASGLRSGLVDAVFASAMAGHAAEVNDFCPSAFVQPGPAVVSTALGVAGLRGGSGRDVLRAIVAGYELACRVPKALGARNLRAAGLANHGVGPVFGAAATASALLGLSADQVASVWAYCAQQASGSWQWLLDVDHLEKAFVFAGMGARNGLQAALLVEAGMTGVPDALDVPGGWLGAGPFGRPGSDLDRAALVAGLGERFELPLVGIKRYPVGGPTQPAVQALLELLDDPALPRGEATAASQASGDGMAAAIEAIRIDMPGRADAFATAEMPALNLPYLCAVIVLDGGLDVESSQSRERMLADPAVRALMARVTVTHDPDQEREPRAESARVTVELAGGESASRFVAEVEGFPSHPMPGAAVEAKARSLLAPALGDSCADRVVDLVAAIEDLSSVEPLVAALEPAS
jgi:2-methylcitrate dehydratase PrpD